MVLGVPDAESRGVVVAAAQREIRRQRALLLDHAVRREVDQIHPFELRADGRFARLIVDEHVRRARRQRRRDFRDLFARPRQRRHRLAGVRLQRAGIADQERLPRRGGVGARGEIQDADRGRVVQAIALDQVLALFILQRRERDAEQRPMRDDRQQRVVICRADTGGSGESAAHTTRATAASVTRCRRQGRRTPRRHSPRPRLA